MSKRHDMSAFAAALLVALTTCTGVCRAGCDGGTAAVGAKISADRIIEHIQYLSSDELGGRSTGEPGCEAAAGYIAGLFAKAGLAPAGDDGSYLQAFDAVVGTTVGEGNELSSLLGDARRRYELDVDFRPLSFSESAVASGGAVFVGYGITAGRQGYDDYEGMDVEGKVAIVMRHEPGENEDDSPFDGTSPTYYSDLQYKAVNAREHGASAMVLITDPLNHEGADQELLEFDPGAGKSPAGIPCVQMSLGAARDLLEEAGLDIEELQADIDTGMKPHSAPLQGVFLSVATSVTRDVRRTHNVLGLLEGADPNLKAYTIVVGAHYDHLGTADGAVYHGADDNASGTAAVLELARVLGAHGAAPARSVLFAAFSGEELGLLGSSHLADAMAGGGEARGWENSGGGPNSPGAQEEPRRAGTVEAAAGRETDGGEGGREADPMTALPDAMINMDMVGRLRNDELMIGGVGSSPLFRPMLNEMAETHRFVLDYSEAGYGPSDHSSFYAKGVPVLFFFTGVHDDYHKPTDTWDKIDPEGEARVAGFVLDVVKSLAAREEPIAFSRASGEAAGPPGGERYGGYGRARLGVIPDFSGGDSNGVRISGAAEGSPAEAAGMAGGDVIVSFDGRAVKSLRDLTYFLKDKKPGDSVVIIVLRGGREVTLNAVLGERTGKGHH